MHGSRSGLYLIENDDDNDDNDDDDNDDEDDYRCKSVNFKVSTSRFFMEVELDYIKQKMVMAMTMTMTIMMMIMIKKMIIAVTQSIFKLGPRNFPWK